VVLLYPYDNLLEFVPDKSMKTVEIFNSVVRFSLIYSIIMSVLKRDPRFMFVSLVTIVFLYVLASRMNKEDFESLDKIAKEKSKLFSKKRAKEFRKSSPDNPFGNYIYHGTDKHEEEKDKEMLFYGNDSKSSKKIKEDIDKNFLQGLKKTTYNLYDENLNLHAFKTLPNTNGYAPSVLDNPVFYKEMLPGVYKPKSMEGRYDFDRRDDTLIL
jgi:hypothetical protein